MVVTLLDEEGRAAEKRAKAAEKRRKDTNPDNNVYEYL